MKITRKQLRQIIKEEISDSKNMKEAAGAAAIASAKMLVPIVSEIETVLKSVNDTYDKYFSGDGEPLETSQLDATSLEQLKAFRKQHGLGNKIAIDSDQGRALLLYFLHRRLKYQQEFPEGQ